jgi:hypothetical protein
MPGAKTPSSLVSNIRTNSLHYHKKFPYPPRGAFYLPLTAKNTFLHPPRKNEAGEKENERAHNGGKNVEKDEPEDDKHAVALQPEVYPHHGRRKKYVKDPGTVQRRNWQEVENRQANVDIHHEKHDHKESPVHEEKGGKEPEQHPHHEGGKKIPPRSCERD